MSISNRYEFIYFVECINGNPNGDPDMGNSPRLDPQDMHGLISDVAVKRRIRNYIQICKGGDPPYGIVIQQSTNINKFIAQAVESSKSTAKNGTIEKVRSATRWICENFYDARTFGAVLSTGANAGQVRGPVQLTFLRSIDPVVPMDISITRMAVAEKVKDNATFKEIEDWEKAQPEDKFRTKGRKQLIPYGLYEGRVFVSANLAEKTGFNEEDLNLLIEAMMNMYEHDRSSSKGMMTTINPIIIFRHIGTDTDSLQRARQVKLGCAPAQRLFNLVSAEKKPDVLYPRKYEDYHIVVTASAIPAGVEIGYAYINGGRIDIEWGKLPNILKGAIEVI